jgi:hypothetical protein
MLLACYPVARLKMNRYVVRVYQPEGPILTFARHFLEGLTFEAKQCVRAAQRRVVVESIEAIPYSTFLLQPNFREKQVLLRASTSLRDSWPSVRLPVSSKALLSRAFFDLSRNCLN